MTYLLKCLISHVLYTLDKLKNIVNMLTFFDYHKESKLLYYFKKEVLAIRLLYCDWRNRLCSSELRFMAGNIQSGSLQLLDTAYTSLKY